jgi:hypothetical protein
MRNRDPTDKRMKLFFGHVSHAKIKSHEKVLTHLSLV